MPAITKFSVWEPETRKFITDAVAEIRVKSKTPLAEDRAATEKRVTNWMYSAGIEAFSVSQGKAHHAAVEKFRQEHDKRPEITLQDMLANKVIGFQALYQAFIAEFARDNEDLENMLRDDFETYKTAGLQHEAFFTLQALVTTNMNAMLDRNPYLDNPKGKMDFMLAAYEEAKTSHPDLISEIDAQLLLQKEFTAYQVEKRNQQAPVPMVVLVNDPRLFAPSAMTTQAREALDQLYEINFRAPESAPRPG